MFSINMAASDWFLNPQRHDMEEAKWTMITPLVFGTLSGVQALLLETKILLSFVSSSLMCIHVVIGASMLASRYQVRISPSAHQKSHRTRPARTTTPTSGGGGRTTNDISQTRRLLTVSFLKSGMSKIPSELRKLELDGRRGSAGGTHPNSDRSYLMDNVAIAPLEPCVCQFIH